MRAVVQRVSSARVLVEGEPVGQIGRGLLVLVAVEAGDGEEDLAYLSEKICHLRLFEDDEGRMNRSVCDVRGALLVVSQFTLAGDCRRGRRPSFSAAASPAVARPMYEAFVAALRTRELEVQTGVFQAHMAVESTNDGPVTLLLDSRRTF